MSRRAHRTWRRIPALLILIPSMLPLAAPSNGPSYVSGWPPAASLEMQPEEILVPQDAATQGALVRGHAGARSLTRSHGAWKATVNPFSGSIDRAFGDGLDLDEPTGRVFLMRNSGLLAAGVMANGSELVANDAASRPLGDSGARVLTFDQRKDGLPVIGAGVSLGVRDGKVVLISTSALGPVTTSSRPRLDDAEALEAVTRYAGFPGGALAMQKEPDLAFYPRLESNGAAQVMRHHLVWRLQVKPPEAPFWEIWNAWVDAHDGSLMAFYPEARTAGTCQADPRQTRATVSGGVRPNRADDAETIVNLPFAQILVNGRLVSADLNGRYPFTGGTASGTLSGDNFRVLCDNCAFPTQPFAAGTASGDVDYGTGGGSSGPPVIGNGLSTPADRTAYFQLHQSRLLMQKWDTLTFDEIDIFTNIDATGNAFSSGYMLGFFRAGDGFRNTAEIRDVIQHELGHTWDRTDGNDITNGGMSEWKGDLFAIAMAGDACMADSFKVSSGFPSPGCSGVRDINEKTADRGIISVGANPCTGVHCLGEIAGQASWHLLNNMKTGADYITLAALPAGNPALSNEQAKWIFERLLIGGGPPMQVLNPAAAGVSIYDAVMLMDDNDANLANGTPHAAYINPAFAHHGLTETPQIIDSAACAPLSDPLVTATLDRDAATGLPLVRLTWTPAGGATNFDVYRNTSASDAFLPLQRDVAVGPVIDSGVQVGATYRYFVAAVRRTGCADISPGTNVVSVTINPPELKVQSATFAEVAGSSDGDGRLEPGERITAHLTLKETSSLSGATGVTGQLSIVPGSSSASVVTSGGPVSFGSVAAGGTAIGASDFELFVGPSESCDGTVHATLAMSGNEGCWLDSFNVPIATTASGCARTPSAFVEVTPGSLQLVSSNGDADGIADNCEVATAQYQVRNGGTLASGPVVATAATTHPGVVFSPPVTCTAANLAGGGSATCQFSFSLGNASAAGVPFTLTANSANNPAPSSLTATLGAERNAPLFTTQSYGFEGSLQGWTAQGFALSTLRAATGIQSVRAGSTTVSHLCTHLTSPTFLLSPSTASTLSLRAYVDVEPFTDQWYDRANVHIVDVDTGVHTVISPASGPAYNAAGNPGGGLCHIAGQNGWAGFVGGFNMETFDLSAFAGRRVRVEVNYGTDELDNQEGIYVDDVSITNAAIELPDAQSDLCVVPEVTAVDVNLPAAGQTRFTWQDLGPGFQYNLYAGTIGSYYSHGAAPVACQGLGAGVSCNGSVCTLDKPDASLPGGSLYFLVTGTAFGREGTSGFASAGAERDPAQSTCQP